MHVLFIHKNYPAQFGHLARKLQREKDWRCEFISELPEGIEEGVVRHQYKPIGGARQSTHFLSRTFENAVAHAQGIYERCRTITRPDLVVGHSGFGSTLFLPQLWPDVPIVNYFEYYYHTHGTDLDFRPEYPAPELHLLRARARNAMILLDLQNCTAGYSPTRWQHSLFPREYQHKIEVLHDGVDTSFWKRNAAASRFVAGREIPADAPVVTYVSRGFESMRGFDVFMRAACRVAAERRDVHFILVGSDTVAYGGDAQFTGGKSFRDHILAQCDYDAARFHFTGRVKPADLVNIFSISDAHVYLTVPFVLSWSLLNAMACGCNIIASDTAPVREVITHCVNGQLVPFHDEAAIAAQILETLRAPNRNFATAARQTILDRYDLGRCTSRLESFWKQTAARMPQKSA